MPLPPRRATLALLLLPALTPLAAPAQSTFTLDGSGQWTPAAPPPEPGSDAAVLSEVRALLAAGRDGRARSLVNDWIERNETAANPFFPEALLLRGDARLADGDDDGALRDWERIVTQHPESEVFPEALARQLVVARRYLNGLRRKVWGMRIDSGVPAAEEIIVRINERLPRSRLAERAMLDLGDFYYRRRDLAMARETYSVFLDLFPRSEHAPLALQRKTFATIARFRGEEHDASPLLDARIDIERFQRLFPARIDELGMTADLTARIDEAAAAQALSVAKWYLRRGDLVSARLQLRRLLRDHAGSNAAREAQQILTERGWLVTVPDASATPQPAPDQPAPAEPAPVEPAPAQPAPTEAGAPAGSATDVPPAESPR